MRRSVPTDTYSTLGMSVAERWFDLKGWSSFAFQREAWRRFRDGESGLIHSATGSGKTLAAWFGPLTSIIEQGSGQGLQCLWITPLRALAGDTLASLHSPIEDLGIDVSVRLRTGDTAQSERNQILKNPPDCLVTTPESLSLMLSKEGASDLFKNLTSVVVDEWHELIGSKRGVLTELALARLRAICPALRIWGVSATLGNLEEALETLIGVDRTGALVTGVADKLITIDSIIPESIHRFPWAGHFGMKMAPKVIEAIESASSSLIFTNTRSMAEAWHQQILASRPQWIGEIGLHHGSLDRSVREDVESKLKDGRMRAVVCTSSLDLGVDFAPVERVIQIGSPKGVARLLQRAGRSGHQPDGTSRVTCVPTHALELVDISSARDAVLAGKIESRVSISKPLDVLAQHLVTIAAGDGFEPETMLSEIRSAACYKNLTDEEWQWALDFVVQGGSSLTAYPEFHRVVKSEAGSYHVTDSEIAQRHRMSIGTIVSDSAMAVRLVKGGHLGTVEESFASRLNPGDRFIFAGKTLEFVRIQEMSVLVRHSSNRSGAIPTWQGGRLPLSSELSRAIRDSLELAKFGEFPTEEMEAVAPILELQMQISAIPASTEILVESLLDEEGHHLFFFPFEGRLVHEGMGALFAYRLGKESPITFSIACNDYGFELLAPERVPIASAIREGLFTTANIGTDILAALNAAEMAKRQFREIARIAGLVFQGYPGSNKSTRQIQASSGLFYDVFAKYDPGNMLLRQADREVLSLQFEESRLAEALRRLQDSRLLLSEIEHPSPLAFPILVDRLRNTVSTESVTQRIERMVRELESLVR